jgi:hypothetical protein
MDSVLSGDGPLCYRCDAPLDETMLLKFKGICDSCNAWTHCCRNCFLFDKIAHNNCKSPSTEWVGDAETFNYCAEFAAAKRSVENGGEGDVEAARRAWDKLFKDG